MAFFHKHHPMLSSTAHVGSATLPGSLGHLVKGPGHDPRALDLKPSMAPGLLAAATGRFTPAPGYVPVDQRVKETTMDPDGPYARGVGIAADV